ncbi:MAG: hypothetical protein LBG65_04665, partial [Puniceicoccales bacterium]|nr:hypothetical protein [Puniceicoccales bacterium]
GDAQNPTTTAGHVEKLLVGGDNSARAILSGNGLVSQVTFADADTSRYPHNAPHATPTLRDFFEQDLQYHTLLSPGDPRRRVNTSGVTSVLETEGAAGTLTFGTASSTTILHNIALEVDLGVDSVAGHSDFFKINGNARIGDLLIDISRASGLWASGRWVILQSDSLLTNIDGRPLMDDWLEDHTVFNWLTAPPAPTNMPKLILGAAGDTLELILSGVPEALVWDGKSNPTTGNLWETVANGLEGTKNQNWKNLNGDSKYHSTNVISVFDKGAEVKAVIVEGANQTYAMEVKDQTQYSFTSQNFDLGTGRPDAKITVSPSPFIQHIGTYNKAPDAGSFIAIAAGSEAIFDLPVEATGVISRGDSRFNYDLKIGWDFETIWKELRDANTGGSTISADEITRRVETLLAQNGLIQIGHNTGPSTLTIGASLLVNKDFAENGNGPARDGRAEIRLIGESTLRFENNQTRNAKNYIPAGSKTPEYDSEDLKNLVITGAGTIYRAAGGSTVFADKVRLGTQITPTSVNANDTYASDATIYIENTGEIHFRFENPPNPPPSTNPTIEQILRGPLKSQPRPATDAAAKLWVGDSNNPHTLTLANDFNTYQGDIDIKGGTLRVEGRLGLVTEEFDNYRGSPLPARYQHGIFNGDINIRENATLEYARDAKASDGAHAYDSVGAGGIRLTDPSLPAGYIWVNNSNYQVLAGKLSGAPDATFRQSGNTEIWFTGNGDSYQGNIHIANGRFNLAAPFNPASPSGQRYPLGDYNARTTTLVIGSSQDSANRPVFSALGGSILDVQSLTVHKNGTLSVPAGTIAANNSTTPGLEIRYAGTTPPDPIELHIESGATITLHLGAGMVSEKGGTKVPTAAPGLKFAGTPGPLDPNAYSTTGGRINLNIDPAGYIPTAEDTEFLLIENLSITHPSTDPLVNDAELLFANATSIDLRTGMWSLGIIERDGKKNLYLIRDTWVYAGGAGNTVPEPSTSALCAGLSSLLLAIHRRRRKSAAAAAKIPPDPTARPPACRRSA